MDTNIDIKGELSWILDRIRKCDGVTQEVDGYGKMRVLPRVCLLEQVIDAKTYNSTDVHGWGRDDEYKGLYNKIRDLLKVRMIEDVDIDKNIKLKHLSAFDGYNDKLDVGVKGDVVIRILAEGAKL